METPEKATWLGTPYGHGRLRAWQQYRASIGRPLPVWERLVVSTILRWL